MFLICSLSTCIQSDIALICRSSASSIHTVAELVVVQSPVLGNDLNPQMLLMVPPELSTF